MRNRYMHSVAASVFIVALASPAFADTGDGGDNDMTPHYGDSWAALQAGNEQPPVPPFQVYENTANPRDSWNRMRENVRTRIQRIEDASSRALNRSDQAPQPSDGTTLRPSTSPDDPMSTSPYSSHD